MKNRLPLKLKSSKPVSLILVSICFLALTSLRIYGQGTIQGVVTDNMDKSPLIACNVAIKGTTLGTVTNHNGEYNLRLKVGTYTLQISYIGYETQEKDVIVEDNQIVVLDVGLNPTSILGEEVIITVQAKGQLAAVNQQLRSNQIVNVVSEERIRELPDENAAQAISRLPGVHLDGSKVVIRGVESKMNKIMINGIEMPSTEGTTRATDMEIVSANMLSGIEVFKTLTPDMDADAIGGVVNLRLREAPKDFHTSITAQGTYNQQEKIPGGFKLWWNISNRYLDNRLGAVLNLNYEKYQGGDDWFSARYSQHNSGDIGEAHYMFNDLSVYDQLKKKDDIGGSVVIDYNLPFGQLLYSGIFSNSTVEETLHRNYMDIGDWHHQITIDRSKNNRLLLNNSLQLVQQFGIFKLDARIASVSNDWEDEFRYRYASKEIPSYVTNTKPFDKNSLTDSKKLAMEPWEVYEYTDTSDVQLYKGHDAALEPRIYDENQRLANIDMQLQLQLSDNIDFNFKFGGKFKSMEREFDENSYQYVYFNVADVHAEMLPWLESIGHEDYEMDLIFREIRDYSYKPNKGFMNGMPYKMDFALDADLMDEFMLEQMDISKLSTSSGNAANDYWGGEKLLAGYLMAEINLGKKLLIIPGARFESVRNDYYSMKVEQGSMDNWHIHDTLSGKAQHDHLLPHLHLRYRVTNWFDIRLSYNNTLSRPDYSHALPTIFYNSISSSARAGNPNIKPAVSENLDANFTFYANKLGLISVSGFKKNINGIFYMQPTMLKNIPDTNIIAEFPVETYPALLSSSTSFFVNSPYTAFFKGLELEWQSNLSWLAEPFNGIVLNANYTHVWSETKYMQDRIKYLKVPGSFLPQPVEIDTFYVNRLLNQANDIANISIGYDYKGLSARLSFRFQGNVISRIGTRPEENGFTNNIYAYDLVVKQKIPLKFADFEVFFNGINLTNVPNKRYAVYPNKGETNLYTRYTGPLFQLGVRLKKQLK